MVEIPKRPHSEDLRFISHSPLAVAPGAIPIHIHQQRKPQRTRYCDPPSYTYSCRVKSPLPLKPARRPQNEHTLIHHPLAHTEVAVDPLLEVFVLGDLVGVEAGAVEDPRRGMKRLAFLFSISLLFFSFLFSFFFFCFLLIVIVEYGSRGRESVRQTS